MIQFFDEGGLPINVRDIPLPPSALASIHRISEVALHATGWYRILDGEHEVTVHYVSKDGTGYTTTIVWD